MQIRGFNAEEAPAPAGGYAQAVEVGGHERTLFVSGQIPVDKDGAVPADFKSQCRLAWQNVAHQLRAADMTLDNVVKVTTFLSDRAYGIENREIRQEILGDRTPALTVIIVGIFDSDWLVEIEAVAVA